MDTFGKGLAIPHDVAAMALPLGAGLAITAMLIAAVWLGRRIRAREPGPPRPDEQPHLPETGPVHEIREMREPDEMPHNGRVVLPHELRALGNMGSRRAKNQKPPTWNEGSSGGFGSGGPGHH